MKSSHCAGPWGGRDEVVSTCPQGGYSLVKEPIISLTMVVSSPEKGHPTQPGGQLRPHGDAEALMTGTSRKKWAATLDIPGRWGT